jgi:N-acetylneuraminate synthase
MGAAMTAPPRCTIVGEVAQAHDGSLAMAHAFIDAIADAGADAVKFQTHIAAAESTRAEPWRVRFSTQDATRFDYWRRMEFTEAQWLDLKHHADRRGLVFLSSPFSLDAVALLQRVGITAWKIASGEINNDPLFTAILATRLPIILSCGMSPLSEVDRAVARIQEHGVPLTLLQCTSLYPCPPAKVGVHLIPMFRERYGCPAGLSDHSGTIFAGLAAATLGAAMVEVHVTLAREMFSPDRSVSITPAELRQLVEGVRFIEQMAEGRPAKDELAIETTAMRALFMKSVAPLDDLPAGTRLTPEHLTLKKPGTGIPAARLHELVGRTTRRALRADELIQETDLESAP